MLVKEVEPSSPFSRYLREGMVWLEINDQKVQTPQEAREILRPGVNKFYIYDRGVVRYLALRLK